MLTLLLTALWRFIPAVAVGLGAAFMPLRTLCSDFSPLVYKTLLPTHSCFYSLQLAADRTKRVCSALHPGPNALESSFRT